jgi:hypothetical protein
LYRQKYRQRTPTPNQNHSSSKTENTQSHDFLPTRVNRAPLLRFCQLLIGYLSTLTALQRADPPKRPAEKPSNPLHAQGVFCRLDLLNKRITHCLNKRINSKPLNPNHSTINSSSTLKASLEGSIVLTIALGIALTILQPQSLRDRLDSVHYNRGKRAHYTTAAKKAR